MNMINFPLLPPTSIILADTTAQMIAGAGQAASATSKASESWNSMTSWLSPWLAIPAALPLAGYGLYRLFRPSPELKSPQPFERELVPRTYVRDFVTTKFFSAKDVRVTVADDGSVIIRNLESGEERPLKPGEVFWQGEYPERSIFTLKTDGGMYLEGKNVYNPNSKPFLLPLRSTENNQTDLINLKFGAVTVTEIAVPIADSCELPKTSKEFREAPTQVNIDINKLSMRPPQKGDLTKGQQKGSEVKGSLTRGAYDVVEAKTTAFEQSEASKKTLKVRIK